jgi:hypothetical protein
MTSFLDILTHRYKQLLIDFGYDKIEVGTFVIAGNECENAEEVLGNFPGSLVTCNGEDPTEEVMEIIDGATLPHAFFINLNPAEEKEGLDLSRIQEIFQVVSKKLMRTHLYAFNINRKELHEELNFIRKAMGHVSRSYEMEIYRYENADKYKFTKNFGENCQCLVIAPPGLSETALDIIAE